MADPSWEDLKRLAAERKTWDRQEAADQREADRKTAMCDGKAEHLIEKAAHVEARRLDAYVSIYECRFCGHWHIGKPQGG